MKNGVTFVSTICTNKDAQKASIQLWPHLHVALVLQLNGRKE